MALQQGSPKSPDGIASERQQAWQSPLGMVDQNASTPAGFRNDMIVTKH
jgi:hypothetical protein